MADRFIASSSRQVYLKHQVTHMYLHSHDVKYRQPIAGQQEITAVPGKNSNCKWITEVMSALLRLTL